MRVYTAEDVESALDDRVLIDALRMAFASGAAAPARQHFTVPAGAGRADGTLLVMPAWLGGGEAMGVKTVSVFPDNAKDGLPSVNGAYLLLDGASGMPRAIMDGAALTARRTAAVSALAAEFMSRPDATTHLVIGAGRLAEPLARAMCAVRPVEATLVWARRAEQAEAVAARLQRDGLAAKPVADKDAAIASADIISCATLAESPVLPGAAVRPGTHLDLVGSFRPRMREADDDAVREAEIHVDTLPGALEESGELRLPLERGVIRPDAIHGSLIDLCSGRSTGRSSATAVTLFKSVGNAIADLVAAQCVWSADQA